MPASTIFQQFGRGQALAGQRELQEQQMEANKLARQKQLLSLDNDRKGAIFQDARTVNSYLKANQPEQALGVLSNRASILEQMGGDTSDTREIADFIARGDLQGATKLLDDVETAGVRSGFLDDLKFRNTRGQSLSDPEKNFNRLTSLQAQLDAATSSGDKPAISAAQSQLDSFKKLTGKFGATTQEKADTAIDKSNKIELAKHASKASTEAFNGLKNVRSTILNIGDAIKAIDKGADTGPIISKLPSFRESSIELDNIRNRMGLDVVGSTTFGALSESELAFALDTALPDNLQPKQLKDWLIRKKEAQTKLAKGLRDAAKFLGRPGNTIADYIENQELNAVSGDVNSGLTEAETEELKALEAQFGGQ